MKQTKLLLCLLLPTFLFAQEFATDLYFTKLDQKIPRAVSNIFEDSRGFLWFGSSGGLCRYDGTEIKLFKAHPIDTNSLSSSLIRFVVEDQSGILWIGTRGRGLNAYDSETGVFEHYLHDPKDEKSISSNILIHAAVDEEGKVWMGFSDIDDLNYFDPLTKKSQRFLVQRGKFGKLQGKVSGNILVDQDRVYLCTTAGFEYYDKKTQRFHFLPLLDEKGDTLYYNLSALHKSRDGKFWMATPSKGIRVYDPKKNQNETYNILTKEGTQNPKIDVIQEGIDGRLWLYCQGQLWSLSPNRKTLQQHQIFIDFDKVDGSTSDAFFIDRYGLLWLQNNYYDPRRSLFEYGQVKSKKTDQPLFINGVESINDSTLKISTGEGYFLQNVYTNEYSKFNVHTFDIVPIGNIDFHPYGQLSSSIRLEDGLGLIHSEKQKIYALRMEKDGKGVVPVRMEHAFDSKKNYWQATWGKGLYRIKYEDWINSDGTITKFDQWLPNNGKNTIPTANLLFVMVDSKDNVWLSGDVGGLSVIDGKDESIRQFDFVQGENSISDTYVFTTEEDKNRNIWIATNNGGLNKYDPNTEEITVFNRENGLIDEDLFRIYSDADGDLWLNTSSGISYLDTESEQFTHYNQNDGILAWRSNGFIDKKTGLLAWAGNEGFITAYVDSIKNRPTYASDIALTAIKVYDSKQKAHQELQAIEWKDHEISLNHQQKTLSLKFSILDFRNRVKHQYQYALMQKGTPDWIDLKENNQVSLNQLAAGTYYFYLKGRNSDQIWTELEQPLKIIIHPPFWQTTWAYLFYALLTIGGIYYFYRFNLKRQLERQEAQQLQEVNTLKSRFYTNITHEFRTPLTVILGMNQEKHNPKAKELIDRNSKKLLQLINQILDLSKLDAGSLKADYQQIEIVSYTQYIGESFQSLADKKYIRLMIYSEIKELWMDMDEEKYRQIISNLFSNAIKFTKESGKIVLHLAQKEQILQIKIKDNGIGIAASELPHIFDRFYQVDNTSSRQGEGTGIGLSLVKELVELMEGKIEVESDWTEGTTFNLQFPIRRTASKQLNNFKEIVIDQNIVKGNQNRQESFLEDAPKLLLIEDNADVVLYIQSILQNTYELSIARNGEEGIQRAIELVPDIIISDVMMPKKNGFEVVETLKQDERTSHIPIILLTAKATQEDKVEGLKYGADAYLMKPFDKEELFIRLKNLIEIRQQLQVKYAKIKESDTLEVSDSSAALSLEDRFLQKLQEVLKNNYQNAGFGVENYAQSLQMSHTQFYRKLKALTNKTPSQYIRSYRLQQAKNLLKNADWNVSEVAYEVGFNDPNYFTRAFRKEFDLSPNAYRK
ncbi:MAG: ATP-binding protein [Bacteroidota bacterium]